MTKKSSGRRPYTREFYDSLVQGFREAPGNATHAARRALCERRAAKHAWDKGWPAYPWAQPIKKVLESEAIAAKAEVRKAEIARGEQAEADRALAAQEAIEARKQEQQMLKAARADVVAALVLAAELVQPMKQVALAVAEACKSPGVGSNGKPLPPALAPALAMSLLTRHATLIQKAVGAAEAVIQLSRLDRGASTVNVGLTVEEDLAPEAIAEEMEAIVEVLADLRALPSGENSSRSLATINGKQTRMR